MSSSPSGPSARPRSSNSGPARASASRCGPSRSSRPSPSTTRRSTSRTASASGSRSSGRRSRSAPELAPMCRSEITRVRTAHRQCADRHERTTRRADRRRLLARPRRPVRVDAAGRPRGRRDQGRAPGKRGRHARVGPAVARRREHLLPRAEPQQALGRARPRRPRRPRAGAAARRARRRAARVLPPGPDGLVGARRRQPAGRQPAARLVLDHRVRHRRAGRPACRATTSCCRRWAA